MEQQTLFDLPAPAGVPPRPERGRPASAASAPGGCAGAGRPGAQLELDEVQAAAVAHRGGGLLVLGGPGTGKTTTVVEVAAARSGAGAAQRVLVLAAGRSAAAQLREQIGARLGAGALPAVATFHSFALAALRAHRPAESAGAPLRLLTAGEQEARLREMLIESVAAGRVAWPAELRGALGTRGIAGQVRSLIARARGLGLDGAALTGLGRRHDVASWRALGPFLEEYLDTLGFEGVIDYQELVHQVMVLAHHPRAGLDLRERFDLVVVDEFQDIEPAQAATLAALARAGCDVVAVGDPDQAMYGFRGGGVGGITGFPNRFTGPTGAPAPVLVLRRGRRCGATIAAAAAKVLAPTTLAPLPAAVLRQLRSPVSSGLMSAEVATEIHPSAAAEAAGIADRLVRAHSAGMGWDEMAVLVRTPAGSVDRLRHALAAAGIPVQVQVGELALGEQPAVAALLDLLAAAAAPGQVPADPPGRQATPASAGRPLLVDPVAAAGLLAGPVGGLDRAAASVLGAELVRRAAALGASDCPDRPAAALAWAVTEPDAALALFPGPSGAQPDDPMDHDTARLVKWLAGAARVGAAIRAGRAVLAAGQHPVQALWALWSATDWPDRLRARALRGGAAGLRADTDLDAVIGLFDLAGRMPAQAKGASGATELVRAIRSQEVPIDLRFAHGPQRPAVWLASAHAAKGRSWSLVVIAGVQDGVWPDLRHRSDLLGTDRLGSSGIVEPASVADTLVAERRLFYSACTRASRQLVVTAVTDTQTRPSRFVVELGVEPQLCAGGSVGAVSAAGIVAQLRELAAQEDPALAQAARARLARLAGLLDASGRPLVPLATASNWWYARPATAPAQRDGRIVLSGSTVAGVRQCPLRWFLDRRCGAAAPPGPAVGIGLLVHEAAAILPRLPGSADRANRAQVLAALAEVVDRGWGQLSFTAAYQERAQRSQVERLLATLIDWHQQSGRTALATEHHFKVDLPTTQLDPGTGRGGHRVRLVGAIDRIDLGADGSVRLVDFKTGRSPASRAAAATDAQLGVYQVAVRHGALADLAAGATGPGRPEPGGRHAPRVGGAELVYLARPQVATGMPTIRTQPALDPQQPWAEELLGQVAAMLASGQFPARPSAGACQTCQFQDLCPAVGRSDDEEPVQ